MPTPSRLDADRLAQVRVDGAYLTQALAALGYTQEEFADHVEFSKFTVNRWCNNKMRVPKIIRLYVPCLLRLSGVRV